MRLLAQIMTSERKSQISTFYYIFFQQRYGHNPITLYHMVQHCLHQEMNLVQKADLVRKLFFVNRETGHVLTFALLQMASDISSSAASPLHDSGGGGGTPSGVAAITPAVGLSSTSAHCNSEAAYQVRTCQKWFSFANCETVHVLNFRSSTSSLL